MREGTQDSGVGGKLFMMYAAFYSATAVYTTYLNLYLSDTGLSNAMIGRILSLSTFLTFLTQMFWAQLSDRSKHKHRVLQALYVLGAAVCMLFYVSDNVIYLTVLVSGFAILFNPVMPLQDNLTLEIIEGSGTDFGQIRMGGTVGYCVTVLVAGFFLKDSYRAIFWLTSGFMMLSWLISLSFAKPLNDGAEERAHSEVSAGTGRFFVGLVLFGFVFQLGLQTYYNFYPIYFVSIGGDSGVVGTLIFLGALTEIPMLLISRRLIHRLGITRLLMLASIATILRWILLAYLTHALPVVLTGLLHGVGYTSFSYSAVTYINERLPRQIRARAQSLNMVVSVVLPKIIAGFVSGQLSESIGTNRVLLLAAGILGVTAILFYGFGRREEQAMIEA